METETKKCPFCGEIIKAEAKKCRFCGNWLNEETNQAQVEKASIETANNTDKNTTNDQQTKKCPFCGETIKVNAIKCRFCGNWLKKIPQGPLSEEFEEDTEEENNIGSMMIGAIVTIILIACVYGIFCNLMHIPVLGNSDGSVVFQKLKNKITGISKPYKNYKAELKNGTAKRPPAPVKPVKSKNWKYFITPNYDVQAKLTYAYNPEEIKYIISGSGMKCLVFDNFLGANVTKNTVSGICKNLIDGSAGAYQFKGSFEEFMQDVSIVYNEWSDYYDNGTTMLPTGEIIDPNKPKNDYSEQEIANNNTDEYEDNSELQPKQSPANRSSLRSIAPVPSEKMQADEEHLTASSPASDDKISNSDNNDAEPDFGPYMRELQHRIKMNWDPPKGDQTKRVVILFKIDRDGNLLSCSVQQSSGLPNADKAAIRAVYLTAPFKPLPAEFKGSSIDISFTFDYNVFGASGYHDYDKSSANTSNYTGTNLQKNTVSQPYNLDRMTNTKEMDKQKLNNALNYLD